MLTEVDFYILNLIQGTRCSFLDTVIPYITWLGNGGIIWIVTAAVLIVRKNSRRHGIMVLCGLCAGLIIGNMILKPLVARPRPFWINDTFELLIEAPGEFSFPSGHTLSSFIAAFILLDYNKKLGAAAIFVAASIAFSRLYLYVHFPSDILGGILLAAVIAYAVIRIGCRKKI